MQRRERADVGEQDSSSEEEGEEQKRSSLNVAHCRPCSAQGGRVVVEEVANCGQGSSRGMGSRFDARLF